MALTRLSRKARISSGSGVSTTLNRKARSFGIRWIRHPLRSALANQGDRTLGSARTKTRGTERKMAKDTQFDRIKKLLFTSVLSDSLDACGSMNQAMSPRIRPLD